MGLIGSNDDKIDEYEEKKRKLEETKKRLQELEREKEKREKKRLTEIQKVEDEKKDAERELARIKQMEIKAKMSIKKAEEEKNREKNEIESNISKEKNKILDEEKRIKDQISKLAKDKEASKTLVKGYKNNISVFKNKLKEIQNKEQKEIEYTKHQLKKIKNQKSLVDPSRIKSISNFVEIIIFYDFKKKKKAYWENTDIIDRIEFRGEEIRNEIKIVQNLVKIKIDWNEGDKERIVNILTGGEKTFHDYDPPGYFLQIDAQINHVLAPSEITVSLLVSPTCPGYPG